MFYRICFILFLLLMACGFALSVQRLATVSCQKTSPEQPLNFQAQGYGGPIKLRLSLTAQGTIEQLEVVAHQETTALLSRLDWFLAQFSGKSGIDSREPGVTIEAMTGATITSRAITRAVAENLHPGRAHKTPLAFVPILLSGSLLLAALGALFLQSRLLRRVTLLCALVCFGLLFCSMFSVSQTASLQLANAPSWSNAPWWWISVVLALAPALLLGRLYCASLCPFAAVQELLYALAGFARKRPNIPPPTDRGARKIKYLILLLLLCTSLALNNSAAAGVEPYITLFTGQGSWPARALLAICLAAAIFYFRFWCRYLCPTGALLALFSRLALRKIRPQTSCNNCRSCLSTCPVQAIDPAGSTVEINAAECILCGDCLTRCPQKSLALQPRTKKPNGADLDKRQPETTARATPPTRLFLLFLISSLPLLTLGPVYNIKQGAVSRHEPESSSAPEDQQLKQQFLDKGLTLHEAKYWKP